jgi:uncharacterized caspase-like protein
VHVFAVGAESYPDSVGRLNFCVEDADEFVQVIRESQRPLYQLGEIRVLTDARESDKFHRDIFESTVKQFAIRLKESQVQPTDLLLVFVAGHGVAYGREFFFIPPVPAIRSTTDKTAVRQHGIPWSVFRNLTESVGCRTVLFMDTCYSGNIAQAEESLIRTSSRVETEKAIMRQFRDVPAILFAATSEGQTAREDPITKHGLFTSFLLQGLRGAADGHSDDPLPAGHSQNEADGEVSLAEAIGYVAVSVRNRYRYQRPTYTPLTAQRFQLEPFVRVSQSVSVTDRHQ